MSIEEEIQTTESLIRDIEEFMGKGVWHPDKQLQVARETVEADKALHQLMDGHTMKIDILSDEQIKTVSGLLKRLRDIKDKPPLSPPWLNYGTQQGERD